MREQASVSDVSHTHVNISLCVHWAGSEGTVAEGAGCVADEMVPG